MAGSEGNVEHIKIRNFGPIKSCDLELRDFTILTGAQATGKSTLAKVAYYCNTLGQEIFNQITTRKSEEDFPASLLHNLTKRLRLKFLQLFGSSWSMSDDMRIAYNQDDQLILEIYLSKLHAQPHRNVVCFVFGEHIRQFVERHDGAEYVWDVEERRMRLWQEIRALLQNPYQVIYIPAGRSTLTLLTDKIASILDDASRSVDYCMRQYIRQTTELRSYFHAGTQGLLEETLHTSQAKLPLEELEMLQDLIDRVLSGRYSYEAGEERLNLSNGKYVKINFASSGQQETVWVFNLLFYHLMQSQPTFLVVEEPESHLFPNSQKLIAEALAVFGHGRNRVLVTTHSPYILGTFNNLLYASELQNRGHDADSIVPPLQQLSQERTAAFYLEGGLVERAIEDGFVCNELIDGASDEINGELERLLAIRD